MKLALHARRFRNNGVSYPNLFFLLSILDFYIEHCRTDLNILARFLKVTAWIFKWREIIDAAPSGVLSIVQKIIPLARHYTLI